VTFAAIACIALLAVIAIALRSAQSSAHRALQNGFAEHAKVSAALTHSLFASTSQASASTDPRLYGAKRVSDGALTAAARQGKLSDLLLLAEDGTIIASSANTSAAVARSVQARPTYVRAALAGQFALSDVIPLPAGETIIDLAQPFQTPRGRRVLVSGFPPRLLSGFIGEYLAGSASAATTHAYLIDGNGQFIASSASPNSRIQGSPEPALLKAVRGGASGRFGRGDYFAASPVRNSSWQVVVTGSQRALFAPVSGASRWLAWVLFAGFACVLCLVLVLVTRLLRSAATQRIADARIREQAEQANQAKSEFLSRMSHELRTPLNAVVGFGQLLELEDLERSQREGVEQILKGGRHLLDLINDVLDISRIESGTMSMSLEPVDLGSVLADALSMIRPLADTAEVRLTADPADAADVYVYADHHRLKQVLVNVLSNAVKYNRPGGEVGARCEELPGARIELAIADSGVGITPDKLERLFAPFDRLGAESTDVEGTGLGLAVSMHLMEAMGGTIKAESRPGAGTTMRLELGRAQQPTETVEDRGAVRAEGNGSRRGTVVYIEDNPSNLKLVERAFEHLPGVLLIPATRGMAGLDLIRTHRPDLVLLDLHLPDISGADVLGQLKRDHSTAAIPVVVVSADATPRQVERLEAAGAVGYMTKPIDIGLLLKTVDANLSAPAAH
jgi:signal transduction histidine kinase/CheY-like chemotaxis protein